MPTSFFPIRGGRASSPSHYLGTKGSSSLPLLLVFLFGAVGVTFAQPLPTLSTVAETPVPSATGVVSPSPEMTAATSPPITPSPSATPGESVSPTASPTPTASATAGATSSRNVRISFLPPPLEGKISLGIYDRWNQLVRVLHQEAELDDFTVGPDALVTKWDGRDNDGAEMPSGKYRARGYVVGPMKIEEIAAGNTAIPNSNAIRIKLMANPLEKSERPVLEAGVGFDDENAFVKTADGLPLVTIARAGDIKRAFITEPVDKSVSVFIDNGAAVRAFQITGISKMMAFDCGDFELK